MTRRELLIRFIEAWPEAIEGWQFELAEGHARDLVFVTVRKYVKPMNRAFKYRAGFNASLVDGPQAGVVVHDRAQQAYRSVAGAMRNAGRGSGA